MPSQVAPSVTERLSTYSQNEPYEIESLHAAGKGELGDAVMQTVRLTLYNYRCFADSEPLRMDLGAGFTALVGPNNSGKSSLLRFFIENRPLWAELKNINQIRQLANGNGFSAGIAHVEDPNEVFCDTNQRGMRMHLEFLTTETFPGPRLLRCTFERSRNGNWTGEFFSDAFPDSKCGCVPIGLTTPSSPPEVVDRKPLDEFLDQLLSAAYIPPFRNAISENANDYYGLSIGTAFITQWHEWATGGSKAQNSAVLRVQDDLKRIFRFKSLAISATTNMKALHLNVDGKPYKLREMGAGLAQFIVVMGSVATRRTSILLIDEPELNLHPSLQVDFLTSLASYTTEGSVLYATHSMGLARTVGDRVYSFRRVDGTAQVKQFDALHGRYAEFAGEMAFSAFRDLGYTALLMVEGPTEVKVMQQFLRMLGKDHEVVVLQLGGSSMIRAGVQQELSELSRLSDHVSVLIDSEKTSPTAPLDPSRDQFLRDCSALGFSAHATERRATENYFTDSAVRQVAGDSARALQPFESLKDLPLGWRKQDNWRIARNMVWSDIDGTDLGAFIKTVF